MPKEEIMKVSQLLSKKKDSRIISIRFSESVETAARMLQDENIGAIVVKDVCRSEGEVVVGMFSERDFIRAVLRHGAGILKRPVSSLMTPNVVSCSPNDSVSRIIELFNKHRIRHLPVIEGGALVGVVSIRDVVALVPAMFEPA